jgi:toxin ParE1/3/4
MPCFHFRRPLSSARAVQRAVERIVSNPTIGRACNDVRPGYCKHAVGSHTLYYRIGSEVVIDVVRVLHQRMDADRHLD